MDVKERSLHWNLSIHSDKSSLHTFFSPFLQRTIPNSQTTHYRKTKDEQCKVDEHFPVFCPLDGIYPFDILFPTGRTLPFLDRAGLEDL